MSHMTLDRRQPLSFGLEPRYLRERRNEQARRSEPAALAAAMAEEARANASARQLIDLETAQVRARDDLAALLRQRVLAADEPRQRRLRPGVALSLALGASLVLWLGLAKLVAAVASPLLSL